MPNRNPCPAAPEFGANPDPVPRVLGRCRTCGTLRTINPKTGRRHCPATEGHKVIRAARRIVGAAGR